MIDCIGIVVPPEDRDAADIDPRRRAEVRERNIRRAAGIRRQKIGRLPDPPTGPGHINRVARGIGWIHRDCTDLARRTGDRRRAYRRPLLTR